MWLYFERIVQYLDAFVKNWSEMPQIMLNGRTCTSHGFVVGAHVISLLSLPP